MSRWKIIVAVCLTLAFVIVGVDGLAAKVTIHRDDYGVPHIYAQDTEGLYYGFGYALAQDRLFQLEMSKLAYYGRISEIFGADYYPLDVMMRRDNLTKAELEEQFAHLNPHYQMILNSFASGINAWIDKVLADKDNKLPYEFHQLGILPERWTNLDAVTPYLISLGWFMDLTNELPNAELYAHFLNKFGAVEAQKYFDDMVWGNDPGAVTTIVDRATQALKRNDQNQFALLDPNGVTLSSKEYRMELALTKDLLASLGFPVPKKVEQGSTKAFSYAVVVDEKKSKLNVPLVMGGPQFGHWLPSMLYEVGLHAPGVDVVGSGLVGTTFIMFGHNQTAAISATAGAGNVEDIFEEKLNPDNPNQYWYKGKWVDMQTRVEKITVKGETSPREEMVYTTVHGPIISLVDKDGDGKNDLAYSKALSCRHNYLDGIQGFTELMLAETPEELKIAGSHNTLSINFFYADKKGNTAYYHCGSYPIRTKTPGFDPRFPTPGNGDYDWIGFVPEKEHPFVINPTSTTITNWNNKPSQNWANDDLSSIFNWAGWSQDHRVCRINDFLAAKDKVGVEDLEELIHDISDYDLRSIHLKPFLMAALENVTDPQLMAARDYLKAWDNYRRDLNKDGFYDAVGYTLWNSWWYFANENIFGDELGTYWTQLIDNYAGYSVFYRAMLGDKASLPMKEDYFNGRNWNEVFIESLQEALTKLTTDFQTTDMSKWLMPKMTMDLIPMNMVGFPSSFGKLPSIDFMDRGSENHIVVLKKSGPVGINIIPAGQNGFMDKNGVPGAHFDDQLDMFCNWVYKELLFKRVDVLMHAESTEILIFKPKH